MDPKAAPFEYDHVWNIHDWKQFEKDERTANLVLYWGCNFDTTCLDKTKTNMFLSAEHPGIFFVGKQPGCNVSNQIRMEKDFDILLTYNRQVAAFRKGYNFIPYPYDIDHVLKRANIQDVNKIKKTIDVTMCGTNPSPDRPLNSWCTSIRKFNHLFMSPHPPGVLKDWKSKQMEIAKSKIHIVWSTFWGADENSKQYADKNFPWIKFKKDTSTFSRWQTPHFKVRAFDAAALKSIILCYAGPFENERFPYKNSIEDYFEPDVDFLYFSNPKDLEEKIQMIIDDYDNKKYKDMVDSAFSKLVKNYEMKTWYENYIVPIAKTGKVRTEKEGQDHG